MKIKTLVAVVATAALVGGTLLVNTSAARRSRGLTARVTDAAGVSLGVARFVPRKDKSVMVTARLRGLTPGFHGFHVHTTGICDPDATNEGEPSPFYTAGGHYNPTGATHGDHAGDMPGVLATQDGTAYLSFVTDRFRTRDLMDDDGSAVILHAMEDNLAHIPATTSDGEPRYHSHAYDTFGADQDSLATGDAGARAGCGVVTKERSGHH